MISLSIISVNAKAFNQPIAEWNVSNVEEMELMFDNSAFKQVISDKWAEKAEYAM